MKKIKLIAISKSEHRCQFTFPKEQQFFEIFRKFVYKLGILDEQALNFGRIFDEKEDTYMDREDNIKEITDQIIYFSDKEYSIDIIGGKGKIFLIIYSKTNKQQFISKCLEEFIKN
jgi:hypothetical protein